MLDELKEAAEVYEHGVHISRFSFTPNLNEIIFW